jgi:hypothetical protein
VAQIKLNAERIQLHIHSIFLHAAKLSGHPLGERDSYSISSNITTHLISCKLVVSSIHQKLTQSQRKHFLLYVYVFMCHYILIDTQQPVYTQL